jgi:Trypsin-co-occurring domain 1
MADIQKLQIEEDGATYTIYVDTRDNTEIPEQTDVGDDRESYGLAEDAVVKLQEVHQTIRAYTKYAIGAFINLGAVEVEEINLKFGLKIGGKTGIPILTEGSAEANFEIQVTCKFPKTTTKPME